MVQLPAKYEFSQFQPLTHASFIELFFDLVFIFCMRSIIPVITGAGEEVDLYTYYTFAFSYFVMLQVWFSTTILMNRFGTGGALDTLCLAVNMFLLLAMTHCISTGWENYLTYNLCWILVNVNLALHWFIRLKLIQKPERSITLFVRRVVLVLLAQVAVIAVSLPIEGDVGQVLCFAAFVVGLFSWNVRAEGPLGRANGEHLIDRCALLVILAFGEMVIAVAQGVGDVFSYVDIAAFFLLTLGMFLVYQNHVKHIVDQEKLGNGFGYIAVSAFITFCVGNVTAGFEMLKEGVEVAGLNYEMFFALAVCVFLLSFFLLLPVSHNCGHIRRRWVLGRAAVSVLFPLLVWARVTAINYVIWNSDDVGLLVNVAEFSYYGALIVSVLVVFAVGLIDRHVFKVRKLHW